MAYIDAHSGEVVIRVVYDGPSGAGKTTNVEQLGKLIANQRRGLELRSPGPIGAPTELFDWLEFSGGYVDGRRVRYQILSVPGLVEHVRRRQVLLAMADVVVFVCDAEHLALEESAASVTPSVARADEAGVPAVRTVIQCNKQDLPAAKTPDEAIALLRLSPGTPAVATVATRGQGVMETFVLAVRFAVDRVRVQLLQELVPRESPDDGFEHLLASLSTVASAPRPAAPPWPQRRNEIRGGDVPIPVAAQISSGLIWPPVNGRSALTLASRGTLVPPAFLRPWAPAGSFELVADTGFVLHSSDRWLYDEEPAARLALLTRARELLANSQLLPANRALALGAEDNRWRLWLVTPDHPSIAEDVFAATTSNDPIRMSAFLDRARAASRLLRDAGHHGRPMPAGCAGISLHDGRVLALALGSDDETTGLQARDPMSDLGRFMRQLTRGRPALESWFEREGRSFVENELEEEGNHERTSS